MAFEYDIWSNYDKKITSRIAQQEIVDDDDAPYGYHTHEMRVTATSRRNAIQQYRKAVKDYNKSKK